RKPSERTGNQPLPARLGADACPSPFFASRTDVDAGFLDCAGAEVKHRVPSAHSWTRTNPDRWIALPQVERTRTVARGTLPIDRVRRGRVPRAFRACARAHAARRRLYSRRPDRMASETRRVFARRPRASHRRHRAVHVGGDGPQPTQSIYIARAGARVGADGGARSSRSPP